MGPSRQTRALKRAFPPALSDSSNKRIRSWVTQVPNDNPDFQSPDSPTDALRKSNSRRTGSVSPKLVQDPPVDSFDTLVELPASDSDSMVQNTAFESSMNTNKTTSTTYRYDILDSWGIQIGPKVPLPQVISDFLERNIFKERNDSPLSDDDVLKIIEMSKEAYPASENHVSQLVGLPLLSYDWERREGLALNFSDKNKHWPRELLPAKITGLQNIEVKLPRPDRFIGYRDGSQGDPSPLSRTERMIMKSHLYPYAVPSVKAAICYPFLIFEIKSDANGGTLWVAEHQAAAGGTACVRSLEHLIDLEMKLRKTSQPTSRNLRGRRSRQQVVANGYNPIRSIAFSYTMNSFLIRLYIHFADKEGVYIMRHIRDYVLTCEDKIKLFNKDFRNICDWAFDTRLPDIKKALAAIKSS